MAKRKKQAPPPWSPHVACCGTCPHWRPPEGDDEAYGECQVTVTWLPFEAFVRRNVAEGYPKGEPSLVARVRGNLTGLPVATTHKIRERRIKPIEEVRHGDDWGYLRVGGWGVCERYAGERAMAPRWERGTFVLVVPGVCDGPEGDDPGEEAVLVAGSPDLAGARPVATRGHQLSLEALR